MANTVSIAACQYLVRPIHDFDEFASRVRQLLNQTQGADMVVFPELFTIEFFTTLKDWRQRPISDLVAIDQFTSDYLVLFQVEAKKRGQHIVGGSHLMFCG